MRNHTRVFLMIVIAVLVSLRTLMCTFAFDISVFSSDDKYTADLDDMDGAGWIYNENLNFQVETDDDSTVEMSYALYATSENEAYPILQVATYREGISAYEKVIFKTNNYRYTFNLSNVEPFLSDDGTGLSINIFLFDVHAMEMLKDFAESRDPIPFRIVCSGNTINGKIQVDDPQSVTKFYDDYEKAGGFKQGFFERYSDAPNYICDVVNLLETEEQEDDEPVEVSYSDKLVIAVVQQALTLAGYDSGKADGIIGAKTSAAISNYQSENGLDVTGSIDEALVEKLGVTSEVQNAAKKEASKGDYSSSVTYEQLSRNPDVYNNTKVTFRGKVLQDIEETGGQRGMRLAINSDYDNVVYVFYDSDLVGYRILEDDQITIYGKSAGIYTYTSTMNASISIPRINADIIEIHY